MSEPIKVFELAKELDLKALELIEKIKPLDLKIKNHMAELSEEQVETIKKFLNPPAAPEPEKKKIVVRKKKVAEEESSEKKASNPSVMIKKAGILIKKEGAGVGSVDTIAGPQNPSPHEVAAHVHEETETPNENASQLIHEEALGSEQMSPEVLATAVESTEALAEPEEVHAGAEGLELPIPSKEQGPAETPIQGVADQSPETVPVAAPVRRGNRYSIIRVVSPATGEGAKPRIIEEAPAGGIAQPRNKAAVPKTFADPELARSASALIREIEAEEEQRRKKAGSASRSRVQSDEISSFKSTDYLRRERVYQPKKKKISIGGRIGSKSPSGVSVVHKRTVEFQGDSISVETLADQMAVKVREVMRKLADLGVEQPEDVMDPSEWRLDFDTASIVVEAFENDIRDVSFKEEEILRGDEASETAVESLPARSPVVTIMGHVDHGKTSLLDFIRRARVAAGEAGGITQHIGAYVVDVAEAIHNLANQKASGASPQKGEKSAKGAAKAKGKAKEKSPTAKSDSSSSITHLTFLDTPGHAAFSSMRSRGAKVTDIVILVVSAIDGVMPQTKEAVEHARAAGVPIIVAVNKIDLPEANPDRIKKQLGDLNIIPEEWGGDNIFVHVSAKTGEGVDKLLEMIQVQAEVLQLKAPNEGPAEGSIVEAKLDKGRGPVATVLVKKGLLKVGEYIVAGTQFGKVRALINDKGQQVKTAGPSTPVEILGLGGVPEAGDALNVVADERAARTLSDHRITQKKEEFSAPKTFSVEELMSRLSAGEQKELPVILKADVRGSAEAISAALQKIPADKVRLKVLSVGVGAISESDVLLASASKALVLGFNVRPDNKAQGEAERRGVQVRTFTIIYELLDEVTKIMEGLLAPTLKETIMGRAEVRNVFAITKVGTVAGCNVIKGKIQRSNQVRLLRDGRVIYTGKMSGLKRFKDDTREVAEGYECGISIENYQDIKVGDVIEAFQVEETATKLTPATAP